MNKKLLVSVFLFFFIFSSVMLAQKEEVAKTIEHLVWADTLWEISFVLRPVPPCEFEEFESDPFLTFHVPASPKSDTLFLECWAQAWFTWSDCDLPTRSAKLVVMFRVISEDIPGNIAVEGCGGTVIEVYEMNVVGTASRRSRRYSKIRMSKNSVDWWNFYYKDSGEWVPDNKAQKILNKLIKNGFDVEVYTSGKVEGVEHIRLIPVQFHVTRITKINLR